jgi:predicted membrane channel-forming protein YqfA (hemolysin III family)
MKHLDNVKTRFEALDDEEKVFAILGTALGLVVLIGLLFLILALLKAMFVPAVIGLVLYFLGTRFFGWPIPSFVKKLFK